VSRDHAALHTERWEGVGPGLAVADEDQVTFSKCPDTARHLPRRVVSDLLGIPIRQPRP